MLTIQRIGSESRLLSRHHLDNFQTITLSQDVQNSVLVPTSNQIQKDSN